MAVSSFISLSRDNILRYVLETDEFLEKNPALQNLRPQFEDCASKYKESKAQSSCGCGGSIKIVLPCVTQLVDQLESLRDSNPAAIRQFVEYVAKRPVEDGKQINVTIYCTREGEQKMSKYSYIA
jgi:hypothetical protein